MTGLPGAGPSFPESVLKRRLNSQTLFTLPSAVFTVYVSRQCSIEVTCPSAGAFFRSGLPPTAGRLAFRDRFQIRDNVLTIFFLPHSGKGHARPGQEALRIREPLAE